MTTQEGIKRAGPPQAIQKLREDLYMAQITLSETPSADWKRLFYETQQAPSPDFPPRAVDISGHLLRFRTDAASVEAKTAWIDRWIDPDVHSVAFHGYDSGRQQTLFLQHLPGGEDLVVEEDYNALHWQHYWNCQPCSYPDRTGDLRSIVKPTDFYSARQWHSTGMYTDVMRPQGLPHFLELSLPEPPGRATGRALSSCPVTVIWLAMVGGTAAPPAMFGAPVT